MRLRDYDGASNSPCLSAEFTGAVAESISSATSTPTLALDAMAVIADYAAAHSSVLVFGRIVVYRVLSAMLEGAPICGGTRYTSCAIFVCSKQHNPAESLKNLAHDWAAYLLWPSKSSPYIQDVY